MVDRERPCIEVVRVIPTTYRQKLAMDRPVVVDDHEPVLISMADVLDDALADLQRGRVRHEVIRHGDREPLPKWLRVAVLKRDGFTCRWCFKQGGRLEVDHVIPWSAGGPDASWNLRTLCWDCNQTRSNWVTDTTQARVLPIVLGCPECVRDRDWWPDDFPVSTLAWCNRCQTPAHVPLADVDRDPMNARAAA